MKVGRKNIKKPGKKINHESEKRVTTEKARVPTNFPVYGLL